MAARQSESEILGTTTVTDRYRIALIKAARENGLDVEVGDRLVYRLEGEKIVLEPA